MRLVCVLSVRTRSPLWKWSLRLTQNGSGTLFSRYIFCSYNWNSCVSLSIQDAAAASRTPANLYCWILKIRFLCHYIRVTNLDLIPSSCFARAFGVSFSQPSIEIFDQTFIPYLLLVDQYRSMVKLSRLKTERRVC